MTFHTLVIWVASSLHAVGPGYPSEAACWEAERAAVEDLRISGEIDGADNPALHSACIPEGPASAALWRAAEDETAALPPNGGF